MASSPDGDGGGDRSYREPEGGQRATGYRVTVEPVFFLYMAALFFSAPAVQQTAYLKYCRLKFGGAADAAGAERCQNGTSAGGGGGGDDDDLQADASWLSLYATACSTLPMLLACAFLGAWSDARGRKWPQVVPLVGAALGSALAAYIAWDERTHPLLYLACAALQGASGGYAGVLLTSYSYLTAVVPRERLMRRVAVAEGAISLGLLAGTLLSGVLLDRLGLPWIFASATAVHLAAAAYAALGMPEVAATTPAASGGTPLTLLSCAAVAAYARCIVRKRPRFDRMYLHLALASFFFGFCTLSGASQVLFLFLTKVHGFTATMYGVYQGVDVLLKVTVGTAVVVLLTRCFRWSDLGIVMLGCASSVLGYGLIGAATRQWMLWLGAVLNSLSFFYSVALRSYVSKLTPEDEHGRVFAFMGTGQTVFTLVASVAFNVTYPLSLSFYPGLCFSVAAALSVVALSFAAYLAAHTARYAEVAGPAEASSDPSDAPPEVPLMKGDC